MSTIQMIQLSEQVGHQCIGWNDFFQEFLHHGRFQTGLVLLASCSLDNVIFTTGSSSGGPPLQGKVNDLTVSLPTDFFSFM